MSDVGEVIEISRGEIVDAAHFVPLLYERVGQGRTDKTCDSGDEITGHLSSAQMQFAGVFARCVVQECLPYYQGSQCESECERQGRA